MIQVGDLVKHRHIGGLGLVKSVNTVVKSHGVIEYDAYQAKIQWLINPYQGGGYTVVWTNLLVKSETK